MKKTPEYYTLNNSGRFARCKAAQMIRDARTRGKKNARTTPLGINICDRGIWILTRTIVRP